MAQKLFTLETLAARHGDCLLLHWGDPGNPRLAVIDGGPDKVYRNFLSKRLNQLRVKRQDPLPIDLVMISHVDDDHINGILDLTKELEDREEEGDDLPYEADSLWFNGFDDIVGNASTASTRAWSASVANLSAAGAVDEVPADHRHAAAVIASVGQGRTLRDRAARRGMDLNGGDPLIVGGWIWNMGGGLEFHVLGPRQEQIDDFQEAWDREVKKKGWAASVDTAEVAAYLDKSPYNLASIVVLAKLGSRSMLLTGDARGDDILEYLRTDGVLTGDSMEVDILKVPHHGSDNNVATEFFRKVKADHYVISGDGRHHNPEITTLKMIVDARGSEKYRVHCTYRKGIDGLGSRLTGFLNGLPSATRKKFVFRSDSDSTAELGFRIDLGKKLAD